MDSKQLEEHCRTVLLGEWSTPMDMVGTAVCLERNGSEAGTDVTVTSTGWACLITPQKTKTTARIRGAYGPLRGVEDAVYWVDHGSRATDVRGRTWTIVKDLDRGYWVMIMKDIFRVAGGIIERGGVLDSEATTELCSNVWTCENATKRNDGFALRERPRVSRDMAERIVYAARGRSLGRTTKSAAY